MATLGDEFPEEIERTREKLKSYESIGIAGLSGANVIRATIKAAEKAQQEQDVVAMIRLLQEMRNISW